MTISSVGTMPGEGPVAGRLGPQADKCTSVAGEEMSRMMAQEGLGAKQAPGSDRPVFPEDFGLGTVIGSDGEFQAKT